MVTWDSNPSRQRCDRKQFNVKPSEGAITHKVLPGSPADKAGLEPGDLIVRLDGQKIDGPSRCKGRRATDGR